MCEAEKKDGAQNKKSYTGGGGYRSCRPDDAGEIGEGLFYLWNGGEEPRKAKGA